MEGNGFFGNESPRNFNKSKKLEDFYRNASIPEISESSVFASISVW